MSAIAGAICAPDTFPVRRIAHCPTCKRRRRFSGLDAAWYGARWTCCGCGDSFGDGERLTRPMRRAWRKDAIAKAKRVWDEAGRVTRADRRAWIRAQFNGGSDA